MTIIYIRIKSDIGYDYSPPGKPTRLAPIPKPAPERLVTPMVGT